ncbi:MAG: RuBisCO large subunit C-terminal-like domain-containing protein [Elusimicrobiota bacterium]
MRLDQQIFNLWESVDKENYIFALYYMQAKSADLLKKVESLALEQSTGTWVSLPEESDEIRGRCVAKVISVQEIPSYEVDSPKMDEDRKFIFLLAFPAANINGQIPQLLTAVYGNISMVSKLKLLDIFLPQSFVKKYSGPKFGIEGLRKLLKIQDRPLLCAMFKPCIGLPPKVLGKMLWELGKGGIDLIKDDELLADPAFCSVDERLEVCLKSCEKVFQETGRKVLYAINITDNLDKMFEKARRAIKAGANCLMVNTYTVSFSAMSALAESKEINVPILAHPDFAGTLFTSPEYGMTSSLVLGKLARLSGADMVVYPSYFGKVPMLKERVLRIGQELTAPFYDLKRVLPCPSAGMHPGVVGKLMEDFGDDVLIGAGGGIHGHPLGLAAGAAAFHQAIDLVHKKIPFTEVPADYKELQLAIQKWGVYDEKNIIFSLLK